MTMTEAIERTVESLAVFASGYDHWAIAFSGGKDSSAVATLVPHLIRAGKVKAPKSLTVLYADTLLELPPLQFSAMGVLSELARRGIETKVVKPPMDDRFCCVVNPGKAGAADAQHVGVPGMWKGQVNRLVQ